MRRLVPEPIHPGFRGEDAPAYANKWALFRIIHPRQTR
jgi:hypothetical protein